MATKSSGIIVPDQKGLYAPVPEELQMQAARSLFALFSRTAARPLVLSSRPHVSCAVSSAQDCVTDQCMIARLVPGVASDALDGTMGLSTGVNAFLGANGALRARAKAAQAASVGYADGERAAHVELAGRVVQAAGGTLFFGVRGLTLASYIKNVDTSSAIVPTLLGRVTYIVSTVGNALWGVFYALLGVLCMVEIYNASKFRAELEEAMRPGDDQLVRFKQFWDKWNGREIVNADDLGDFETRVEAGRAHAIARLKKMGLGHLTQKELERIVYAIAVREAAAQNEDPDVQASGVTFTPKTVLEFIGFDVLKERYFAQRRLALIAAMGPVCAKKFEDLGKKIDFTKPVDERHVGALKTLLKDIRAQMDANFWVNVGYLVACMIGVAATIALFVCTGGLAPLLITVAFLVVGGLMILLDGYCVNKALKTAQPHEFDKTMLAVSSAIALIGFAASIAVISVLSLGIVPLIATLVIATLWLGVNGYTWSKLLWNASEQCTLEQFRQRLETEKDKEKLKRLFKNLRTIDRQAILREIGRGGLAQGRLYVSSARNITGDAFKQAVNRRIDSLSARKRTLAANKLNAIAASSLFIPIKSK